MFHEILTAVRAQATDLESLVASIEADHLRRETLCQELPLRKRGPRKRRRPNTAIISYAAQAKIEVRQALKAFLGGGRPIHSGTK
jgi:hypothetical protein